MAVSLSEVVSFGRYEPLFRIASGGMAEVYAARIRGEAGFQKLVAVKRMHPHLASDTGFVDMFLNEARLAAHVASPHVVQTLDLGRGSDGSLYIVMELVVGLSLAALEEVRGEPLPPPIAVELMAQAAQGLDDAHEATTPAGDALGLIHRDISPHNILVGLDGRARVTDFGIARAVHRPREETNVRELKGKFAYMSPEQTRLLTLDRRSDIFSLGVVLWEQLVAERLFATRDPADCIRNVRKKPIPAPHERVRAVPEAISRVTLRALSRDREGRHRTAAELAEELRRVGREVFGRLPDKREIAAFVRDAGGDELDRLQRLIRLGTEGADPEAMEAVRPGATRVLAGEGSGVAKIGDGAKRVTALLDDAGPKIPTVTLPPDDEIFDTGTAELLDSAQIELLEDSGVGDPRTRELRARLRAPAPIEDGPPPRDLRRTRAVADEAADPAADQAADQAPTRAWEAQSAEDAAVALPARAEARDAPSLPWLAAGVGAGVFLVIGALAAVITLWPTPTERVPLPVVPAGSLPTRPPAPAEPATRSSLEDEVRPAEVIEEPDAPVELDARDEPREGEEDDDEPVADEATDPPASSTARARRRARARRARRGARSASSGSDDGPVLLDVNAFDRHTR